MKLTYYFKTFLIFSGLYRPEDTYQMDYAEELAVALKTCVEHHRIILDACKLTEEFLNPLVLAKSLQFMGQICNLAYASYMVNIHKFANI